MRSVWILLLLLGLAVQGWGQYVLASGSPSGGETIGYNAGGGEIVNDYTGGLSGYGSGIGGVPSATSSGQTTWVFNWDGPAGSVPPENVIVAVKSSASYTGPQGACDDGYHDAPEHLGGYSWVSLGTHYIIENNPGQTFTLQLTPSANETWTNGEGSCTVNISMGLVDVTLSISGGLFPGTSLDKCLVGQYQVASFNAGSYVARGATYNWNVTGAGTPQSAPSWGDSASEHIWNPLSYPLNTTSNSQTFFEAADGTQICTCSCTATAPGGAIIGTISAEYDMDILLPQYNFSRQTTNYSTIVENDLGYPEQIISGDPPSYGFSTYYQAQTPAGFVSAEGAGSIMPVQLIDWTDVEQDVGGIMFTDSTDGTELDTTFPYEPSLPAEGNAWQTSDTPSVSLHGVATQSININSSFEMFNVYQPPAVSGVPSPEYVPLAVQEWNWNTSDGGSSFPWPSPTGDPELGSLIDLPTSLFTWTQVFNAP
jgi:hypothetical protein